MKFLSQYLNISEIRAKHSSITERFPVAYVLSLVFTALLIYLVASNARTTQAEIIGRVSLSLVVTFFLSVSTSLFFEARNTQISHLYKYGAQGLVLLFGLIFYSYIGADFFNARGATFFFVTLFGVISSVFIAPYMYFLIGKDTFDETNYYIYFYRIAVVFLLTAIVGGALAILGSIAIYAVTTLFDIGYSWTDELLAYWNIIALGYITVMFGLSELPKKEDFLTDEFHENIFFRFLIRYIGTAFIYVYFIILYAYSIKVLGTIGDWPKGEVSWLVIGFSTFGYILYIFSYIFEDTDTQSSNQFVSLFRKYFPYIVIPQIGMLAYAIFVRIAQYDLTINRYLVVVFGIWLVIVSLYLIISKRKSLVFIPSSLVAITLLISVGPWSVYAFPVERQADRLVDNLRESGILVSDGNSSETIVPLQNYSDISEELSGEIADGIDYVCHYDSCERLELIFPEIYPQVIREYKEERAENAANYNYLSDNLEPSDWEIIHRIQETIKVERYYNYRNNNYIYLYNEVSLYPLDVSEYEYIAQISRDGNTASGNKQIQALFDSDGLTLRIQNDEEQEVFDLEDIVSELIEVEGQNIPENLRSFERSGDQFDIRVYLESVSFEIDRDDNSREQESDMMRDGDHISGYVLVRIK